MTQPRITVITVNRDQGSFLEQTICSVLDQGYERLEYFVLDGGSTDESVDILRTYESDLTSWRSGPDGGPAAAINDALRHATGDIITVVHSGDLLMPGVLPRIAEEMTGRDAWSWVTGHSRLIGPRDDDRGAQWASAPSSAAAFLMHDSGLIPLNGSFFHREMFATYGSFDPSMRFGYDYEWMCRLIVNGRRPHIIGDTLAARRQAGDRTSATRAVRQGLEYITAARRHADALPLAERVALWRNCEARQRIYTLAQAETQSGDARRFVIGQVLRHPWWLADVNVRQTLLHGVGHQVPDELIRPAA